MQARLLQSTDEEDVQSSESESELDDEEDVKSDFEMGMRHRLAKGASVSIPKRALGPPSPKTRTARSGRGRWPRLCFLASPVFYIFGLTSKSLDIGPRYLHVRSLTSTRSKPNLQACFQPNYTFHRDIYNPVNRRKPED